MSSIDRRPLQAGTPVPDNLARPEEVAKEGLQRLPFGPMHNFGLADDQPGPAIPSASSRRQRAQAISQATAKMFGPNV